MRVSTNGAYQRSLGMMQQIQSAIGRTQLQISSGRRILTPSDDPIASARLLNVKESIARLNQFERNGDMLRNRLSFEESALGGANNILQRVRELAIQGNNATQSNESRGLIAIEMREQLDSLMQLANQRDGSGRYLFAGNMDDVEPVARNGNQFTYNGDQGRRLIQIGEGRQVADGDPGSEVFFRVKDGNGSFATTPAVTNTGSGVPGAGSVTDQSQYNQDQYTIRFIDPANYEILDSTAAVVATEAFQSGDVIAFGGFQVSIDGEPAAADEFDVSPSVNDNIFAMIERLSASLDVRVDDSTTRAEVTNGINNGILALDQALGNILATRTQVGSRLQAVDTQEDANAATVLTYQETIADLENLDYAEALSRLSIQASVLEAAQQSFIRTQSLSLFNFL